MKRIRAIKGLTIYEMTETERAKDPNASPVKIYTKDELQNGIKFASPEWECDSVKEAEEWIG